MLFPESEIAGTINHFLLLGRSNLKEIKYLPLESNVCNTVSPEIHNQKLQSGQY